MSQRPTGGLAPEVHSRPVAAGGWRRAALGLVVGAVGGALLCAALPRDVPGRDRPDGRRRRAGR